MRDITIIEGNNELNVQLTPIPPEVSHFAYTNLLCSVIGWVPGSTIYKQTHFSCTITNTGSSPETHVVGLYLYAPEYPEYPSLCEQVEVTLGPGESIGHEYYGKIAAGIGTRCYYVVDDADERSGDCCFST